MIIKLTQTTTPQSAIDARGLAPQNFIGLTHDQIGNVTLGRNSSEILVRDLFEIRVIDNLAIDGIDSNVLQRVLPVTVIMDGDFRLFHRLGQSTSSGCLWVKGSVGSEVAKGMTGGVCVVAGHVSNHAAQDFRGGLLAICGHCGHDLAGAAPGKKLGMTGGDILVGGNTGDRVAHRMRRGTIFVSGNSGNHGCQQMIAGTVVCKGALGDGWCLGMKRGSLIELGSLESKNGTHAGFTPGRDFELSFLQILWRHLREQHRQLANLAQFLDLAFPFRPVAFPQSNWATRRIGDTLVAGRGEWLRVKAPIRP